MTAATPLGGVRVLDLTRALAGPLIGRILESLGADVVKIEPPDGDQTRLLGDERHGLTGYYTQQNAGKRNMCIDLRASDGLAVFRRLAEHADVVLENYRPGVLDRLGIGWDVLHGINPELVLVSVSGYGQTGPEASRPAYAPVIHAESGFVAREAAGGPAPREPRLSIADTYGGLHGTIGALASLFLRHETGKGQHVDVALYDAMLFTDDYAHYALDGVPVDINPGEVWETVDGPIMIVAGASVLWWRLTSHGLIDDDGDPDASADDKATRRKRLMAEYLASFPDRQTMSKELARANVVWGDIRTQAEAFAAPTVEARGVVLDVDDRGGGTRRVVQVPYRFSDAQCAAGRSASYRGEHNEAVLTEWIGMRAEEVVALTAAGVLQAEPIPQPGTP